MFRGQIDACDWRTKDGFTVGTSTFPDLICLIDTDTKTPVTNPDYTKAMRAAVMILAAPVQFITVRELAAFGPAYVGLDQPFVSPLSPNE